MIDEEEFPDARLAVFELINAGTFAGHPGQAFYHFPADEYGQLAPEPPVALVYSDGGTPGYIDQTERITIEVYAEGTLATTVAKAIRRQVCGEDVTAPSGYFDSIRSDQVPSDAPYDATLNKATLILSAISRPIED
ncbi:hypothetical protein ACTXI0_04570 [Arthrobacter rhombi]|uniref:hypothetical protein n=1 Tax=Arthrobacter rhombi TaxID=71253 RepID=UPI003FCFF956